MFSFNYDCLELFVHSFLFVIILAFIKGFIKWCRFYVIARNIPGPLTIPIIGSRFKFEEDNFNKSKRRFEYYGSTFTMWSGLDIYVHFSRAKDVETLLSASANLTKSCFYVHSKPYLGNGLLTSRSPMWNLKRKIMTPGFHTKFLQNYFDFLQARADTFAKELEIHCNDENFEILPLLSLEVIASIFETMMGIKIAEDSDYIDYVQCHNEILKIISHRNRNIWIFPNFTYKFTSKGRRYKKCLNTVLKYNKNIIKERRMLRLNNRENETDLVKNVILLDLLLEEQENGILINDDKIIDEVNTMVFSGNDTTSGIIGFCLFLLGNNHDVQKRVLQEIIEVVGDENRPITMEHLAEMKYLERVFKETLRLYPPAPIIGRIADEDIKIGEYTVPIDGNIVVNIYELHRDPNYFPNPEKFDPDRFLPEACKMIHAFTYIPFGTGARSCIGKNFGKLLSKLMLVEVVKKYRIFSMEKPEEIDLVFDDLLRMKNNFKLKLVKRKI